MCRPNSCLSKHGTNLSAAVVRSASYIDSLKNTRQVNRVQCAHSYVVLLNVGALGHLIIVLAGDEPEEIDVGGVRDQCPEARGISMQLPCAVIPISRLYRESASSFAVTTDSGYMEGVDGVRE